VRTQARQSRFGLLLALMAVLIAVSAPAASVGGHPHGGIGASVSPASSAYDEPHDRPRGSVTAAHTSTTAAPDTWWVVYHGPAGGYTLKARGPVDAIDRAAAPASASTSRSSRAPPHA
jgi:hypothetical protein